LREEYQEKELSLNELSANHKLVTKKEMEKEARVVQLENELEFVNVAFKKEEEQRKTLESELSILRSVEE
jgi:hypothetical protein